MKYPVIILSNSDNSYHVCETVHEVFITLYAECKKFIGDCKTYESCTITEFADNSENALYLFGKCLKDGDFGDICKFIKTRQDISEDGTFDEDLWD